MAESLLVGAAVGAAFGELLKAVLETKDKAMMFRPVLEYLRKILTAIDPLIEVLEQQNKELGRPKEELESLIRDLKLGAELVNKCSKIRRVNIYRRLQYQEQLIALAESLERFFKIDMQAQIARDLKEALSKVNRIHSAINKLSFLRTGSKSDSAFEEMKGLSQIEIHDSTETLLHDQNATETNPTEETIHHPLRRILFSDDAATHPVVAEQVMGDNSSLLQKFNQIEAKADQNSNYNDPFEPIRKITGFEPHNSHLDDLSGSSAEVLGETMYGTSYKVKLKNGRTVVMKRLKDVPIGKKEFGKRMEIAQKVSQHPNVMALLGWHYSNDEKLLIYDYMEAGANLSILLHGKNVLLDWSSRLKISLEVAKGIAHIHSYGGMNFVHGNISSSNVLVRVDDFQSCISYLGLASLVSDSNTLSGSKGYQAPEVVSNGGKLMTPESDVYSFGVLLREIMSGKSPGEFHDSSDDANDMSLRQKRVMDLADRCMRDESGYRPIMDRVVEQLNDFSGLVGSKSKKK